jgi:hypothetical protein
MLGEKPTRALVEKAGPQEVLELLRRSVHPAAAAGAAVSVGATAEED